MQVDAISTALLFDPCLRVDLICPLLSRPIFNFNCSVCVVLCCVVCVVCGGYYVVQYYGRRID